MNNIKFRSYGTMHKYEFPNTEDILKTLENGEIAYVRDMDTKYDYILTKQLHCWTQFANMGIDYISDYEQWKQWLDKWNVTYEEKQWNPNEKELIIGGCYCQASIVFDLNDNFICMTAYE